MGKKKPGRDFDKFVGPDPPAYRPRSRPRAGQEGEIKKKSLMGYQDIGLSGDGYQVIRASGSEIFSCLSSPHILVI
jgi:hypothetical protein